LPDSSTSLAKREAASVVPTPVMTDDEINRTYRLAQMLAASSLFKDVKQAEQAFAKLLLGRDLGLSPAQSLRLYAVEGGIEVPYPLMASFVKNREGYDYTIEWRESGGWVSAKESDGQDVTGCRLTFTVDGEVVGRSTWTTDDSDRAELDRPTRSGAKSNHVKYPRNMFLARAMANGIKWHVPEVAGGHSVYAEGELPRPERFGDDNENVQGVGWGDVPIPWVAEIKKTMRRAEKLGRTDLADEPFWQMRMVGQTAEVWQRELDEAKIALDLISRSTTATAVEDDTLPDDTPEVETPEGVKRPGEDAVVAEPPSSLMLDDALGEGA
jgi:hypothetical protein